MHPNAYLKTFWRTETLDQVFVAMSFEAKFDRRFNEIIVPAIEGEPIAGRALKAYRVDNSKTGDSILTDIADGIAHSRVILADVSVIDKGTRHKTDVRNGNVMYEVGMALACRQPSEVLLIRGDNGKFLFDVSSIPHMTVDFSAPEAAITEIREAIEDRIRETDRTRDARIEMLVRRLTPDERGVLVALAARPAGQGSNFVLPEIGRVPNPTAEGLAGLLNKGCVEALGIDPRANLTYRATDFGRALALAMNRLPTLIPAPPVPQ